MAKSIQIQRSYGLALLLSLMFQISSWGISLVGGSMYGPTEVSGGLLLNWRAWSLSAAVYWLGFLCIFLTRRETPQLWRLLYTGFSFAVLFVATAALVAKIFGAD